MPPVAPDLVPALRSGRLGLYLLPMGLYPHAVVYVVYGWTGAEPGNQQAAKTDDLMEVMREEIKSQGSPPAVMAGDFQ